MMHNDSAAILSDLLSRWHHWAKGFKPVPTCSAAPMFRNAKTSRGWDSISDIVEDEIHGSMMEAMDFQVGEMQDPHRSAIYVLARNCYSGRSVWLSTRLPADPIERGRIVTEARSMLTKRLIACGVM